jgi:hypothetical protein
MCACTLGCAGCSPSGPTRRAQPGYRPIRVVAEPSSPSAHDLRDMLDRNDVAADFLSPDSAEGRALLERAGQDGSVLPVAVYSHGRVQVRPSLAEVAEPSVYRRGRRTTTTTSRSLVPDRPASLPPGAAPPKGCAPS